MDMPGGSHGAGFVIIYDKFYVNQRLYGGESEIRTRDKVTPVPPFQGGDLNRSSSSPQGTYSCRKRIIADVRFLNKARLYSQA